MKSKELNEILNETRRTPNISLTPEQVEELIKDLEKLEILKKIIKQEKENAENNLKMIMSDNNKKLLLVGKIEAYTNIMRLIESSDELE